MSFKKQLILWTATLCLFALTACTGTDDGIVTETDPPTETDATADTTADGSESATETEFESESESEAETTDYSAYTADYGYGLLYKTDAAATPSPITPQKYVATRVKVEADCFLTGITFICPSWGDDVGSMDFRLFRWADDYADTVKAEPVYTYTVKDAPDNQWVTVPLPEQIMGEGEWLYELSNGSSNQIGVYVAAGLPEAEEGAGFSVTGGYVNGRSMGRTMQSYATYIRYEKTGEAPAPIDPKAYTQLTEGKAHVILLTGQSNASGQTYLSFLQNTATAEDYARYEAGYENILIDYVADGNNISNGFVPVKLGQGAGTDRVGPEVGLADHLSRTYPGETFYIIKSSWSASGLAVHWPDSGHIYQAFVRDVTASLARLEKMGLEPEIFAMLWMQGETDACDITNTRAYAENQDALIARITAKYSAYVAPGGFAFIDAAISERACWPYAGIVNLYKQKCDALSQNRYFLDTNALDIDCRDENNDLAHYDSDDMIELGNLFGKAVEQVIENAGKAS